MTAITTVLSPPSAGASASSPSSAGAAASSPPAASVSAAASVASPPELPPQAARLAAMHNASNSASNFFIVSSLCEYLFSAASSRQPRQFPFISRQYFRSPRIPCRSLLSASGRFRIRARSPSDSSSRMRNGLRLPFSTAARPCCRPRRYAGIWCGNDSRTAG